MFDVAVIGRSNGHVTSQNSPRNYFTCLAPVLQGQQSLAWNRYGNVHAVHVPMLAMQVVCSTSIKHESYASLTLVPTHALILMWPMVARESWSCLARE